MNQRSGIGLSSISRLITFGQGLLALILKGGWCSSRAPTVATMEGTNFMSRFAPLKEPGMLACRGHGFPDPYRVFEETSDISAQDIYVS
jgi:hypothetical protein